MSPLRSFAAPSLHFPHDQTGVRAGLRQPAPRACAAVLQPLRRPAAASSLCAARPAGPQGLLGTYCPGRTPSRGLTRPCCAPRRGSAMCASNNHCLPLSAGN